MKAKAKWSSPPGSKLDWVKLATTGPPPTPKLKLRVWMFDHLRCCECGEAFGITPSLLFCGCEGGPRRNAPSEQALAVTWQIFASTS